MALSIKNDEADRLARELAEITGESLTTAITEALRERVDRERRCRRDPGGSLIDDLADIRRMVAEAPVLDDRSADDIIGYDEHGAPA